MQGVISCVRFTVNFWRGWQRQCFITCNRAGMQGVGNGGLTSVRTHTKTYLHARPHILIHTLIPIHTNHTRTHAPARVLMPPDILSDAIEHMREAKKDMAAEVKVFYQHSAVIMPKYHVDVCLCAFLCATSKLPASAYRVTC